MGAQSLSLDEMLLHVMLLVSAVLAMASFYFTSSYSTMLWIYCLGVVGGLVVTVPDWAFFNRSPLSWHEPLGNEAAVQQQLAPRMIQRVHSLQKLAAPSCSQEEVPFRLSSFPCFPSATIYTTAASGGSRC